MVGAFGCPECGRELEVGRLAPGGLLRCEGCGSWVEIPFLPRSPMPRRRRPARWWSPGARRALRLGLAALGIVAIAATCIRLVGERLRTDGERVLAELVASADAAEASGHPDRALVEIEAAVARARSIGSGRLGELLGRRDSASLREARARLSAVASLDPGRAVGEALTLRDRARGDPALAPLAGAIGEALDAQRLRQAEADLGLARAALDGGRCGDAFAAAERLHGRADPLPPDDASRFRAGAEAVMGAAVARSGVAISPASGRFVFGTPELYAARFDALRADALRRKGYLPQPRRSPWRRLWDEAAPFRATLDVVEAPGGLYLQSPNRTTEIVGTFGLECRGRAIWQARAIVTAETLLPDLSAYGGRRRAVSSRRDREVERQLHEDALAQLVERASSKLAGLPGPEAAGRTP